MGLACVSGFMVVIRLFGDTVVERVGRVAVVRFGAVCALVGYGLTAFTSGLAVILAGWCLVGLGVGLLAPQIYGLAGHVGGGARPRLRGELRVRRVPRRPRPDRLRRGPHRPAAGDAGAGRDSRRPDRAARPDCPLIPVETQR